MIAPSHRVARAMALALLCTIGRAAWAEEAAPAEQRKVKWTSGPAKVQVGDHAQVDVPDTLAFAGAEDTRALLEGMGNPTDGSELGLVVPKAQDQDWFIVFEWAGIGYVKDDEKDRIDADALLKSIREGTEESNAERKKRGRSALHVVGWTEPPRYDARTHNLTWAVLARNDAGHESVNYNVRVLGREGVMSVTLVEEPKRLAQAKPAVDQVIGAFTYREGKRYAEWVPGDKVAKYGLTALVAAGAGAAAVKLGLFAVLAKIFAKMGKVIAVAIAALGAGVVKFWNALRGKASARPAPPPADPPAA